MEIFSAWTCQRIPCGKASETWKPVIWCLGRTSLSQITGRLVRTMYFETLPICVSINPLLNVHLGKDWGSTPWFPILEVTHFLACVPCSVIFLPLKILLSHRLLYIDNACQRSIAYFGVQVPWTLVRGGIVTASKYQVFVVKHLFGGKSALKAWHSGNSFPHRKRFAEPEKSTIASAYDGASDC